MAGIVPEYEFDTTRFDTDSIQEVVDEEEELKKKRAEEEARQLEQERLAADKEKAEGEKTNLDKVKEQGRAYDAGQAVGATVDLVKEVYDNTYGAWNDSPVNQELKKAVGVGTLEGIDSLWTAPERFIDMSTGEYARQEKEEGGYTPSWAPSQLLPEGTMEDGPTTWWGGLSKEIVKSGVIVTGLVKAGGAIGLRGLGASLYGRLGLAATEALVDQGSQEGNMSGMVREIVEDPEKAGWAEGIVRGISERVPFVSDVILQNPLATQEDDSPWARTLKAVLENMSIEGPLEFLFAGRGAAKADIDSQIVEKAEIELDEDILALPPIRDPEYYRQQRERALPEGVEEVEVTDVTEDVTPTPTPEPEAPGAQRVADETQQGERPGTTGVGQQQQPGQQKGRYRAAKNKPISDPWQQAPNSRSKPQDMVNNQRKSATDWDTSGQGSYGSWWTPAQAERMAKQAGIPEADIEDLAKQLYGAEYLDEQIKAAGGRTNWRKQNEAIYRRFQEMMGRYKTAVDTKDFYKPFFDEAVDAKDPLAPGTKKRIRYWDEDDVKVADMINGQLFQEVRNRMIAARELGENIDLMSVDGPIAQARDRLLMGLTEVKFARRTMSTKFRNLGSKQKVQAVEELKATAAEEAREALDAFLEFAKDADDDGLVKAFSEFLSSATKPQNMMDLDAYFRTKLRGGGYKGGKPEVARAFRELDAIWTHSVLSSPKTPIKAATGTFQYALLRPLESLAGSLLRGDKDMMHENLATLNGFFQALPEAMDLFFTKLNGYWSGDIRNMKSRYIDTVSDDTAWEMQRYWVEKRGTNGDKMAFAFTDMLRTVAGNKLFGYTSKLMAATDDTFNHLLARSRGRQQAMRKVIADRKKGNVVDVDADLIAEYEDAYMKMMMDEDGNIDITKDMLLDVVQKEATLTTDISGLAEAMEKIASDYPLVRPFYKFTRTGINGLNMSYKNTPMLGMLHKQFFDIMRASDDNLASVAKYGIQTAEDLRNAKAMWAGKQAFGGAVVTMGAMHYMNGGLTGNGPQNRQMRELWKQTGWQPRSVKIGNTWVSYDALEPYSVILAAIADIGDGMAEMGPHWGEQGLGHLMLVVAGSATSKSYMAGMQQMLDLFSNKPGKWEGIVSNLTNNTVPLGALRDDIGKIMLPYARELDSGFLENWRQRNRTTEYLTKPGEELAIKYDILNGEPIQDWNFWERVLNEFSPISLRTAHGPGRQLLQNSNYDLRILGYSAPDGTDLSKSADLRSKFQQAIGMQGIEAELDALAAEPWVKASIERMIQDARTGKRETDPMQAYAHNPAIHAIIDRAVDRAWAQISDDPKIQVLIEEAKEKAAYAARTRDETSPTVFNMKNK